MQRSIFHFMKSTFVCRIGKKNGVCLFTSIEWLFQCYHMPPDNACVIRFNVVLEHLSMINTQDTYSQYIQQTLKAVRLKAHTVITKGAKVAIQSTSSTQLLTLKSYVFDGAIEMAKSFLSKCESKSKFALLLIVIQKE